MHRFVLADRQAHFLRNAIVESYDRTQEASEMTASTLARLRQNPSEHKAPC